MTLQQRQSQGTRGSNPPDHPALGKVSKVQMGFIKKVKSLIKKASPGTVPFRFEPPPILNLGQRPNVELYYIKPVMVFAPHLQCPAVFNNVKCSLNYCGKYGTLKAKEWQSNPTARYVHDITGGFYFMSYLYQCAICSSDKQSFQALYKVQKTLRGLQSLLARLNFGANVPQHLLHRRSFLSLVYNFQKLVLHFFAIPVQSHLPGFS